MFVGYDPREPVAYHTFCSSVLTRSSAPVSFTPLYLPNLSGYTESHGDGSNQFIYSRFLVPHLCNFTGWAIFADGDMLCMDDIAKLWDMRDYYNKGVLVAKHDYKTKHAVKYLGAKNEDYPRKNWSSVILWNCAHHRNKILTPDFVAKQKGSYLHRFEWLQEHQIGEIPKEWNWLVSEYEHKPVSLAHYTLGTPCFKGYENCDYSQEWHNELQLLTSHSEA